MKRSTDRILTTHAGSLPRPADLLAMSEARQDGKPVDDTRSITVKANDKWSVDFTKPEPKPAK